MFVSDELEKSELKNGAKLEDVVSLYEKFHNLCVNVTNHTNLANLKHGSSEQVFKNYF